MEFGSAAEENKVLDESIGVGVFTLALNGLGLAIDEARGRIYAADNGVIRVLELEAPHKLLLTIDGSTTPATKFTSIVTLAVNEKSGDLFVFDGSSTKSVYQLTKDGEYIATVISKIPPIPGSDIGVDNGPFSPHPGYLFVPSEEGSAIILAFKPTEKCSPEVKSSTFANVTDEDAELRGVIDPCDAETQYVFEYTTQADFEEKEFAGATVAGGGQIPVGSTGVPVSAAATGLLPSTTYYFRLVATNTEGSDEESGRFTTYPSPGVIAPCPNDAGRTGLSALLPDCRAYELVTPPDTNGRTPRGLGKWGGIFFGTREASPAGDKVTFYTEGGTLPGTEGTGSLSGDPYLSTRGPSGWSTAAAGPNGVESTAPLSGSTSPDQGYSFWQSNGEGSAPIEGKSTTFVRYPDGHSEPVGQGALGIDPGADARLIGENGSHILFVSTVELEENAPPGGTESIYDRTPDGTTHVVSLLPGDLTPAAGEDAFYLGASLDGEGVAFRIGSTLYLRYDNEETYEVAEEAIFAGVVEGGGRIFYVKGGDLFAFDVATEETISFAESGDATVVNVSADGSAAYFVSPSVLTGGEENPAGDVAQAGEENLYLSREGTIGFVGTVTQRDVEGEVGKTEKTGGLGLWTEAVGVTSFLAGRFSIDPSRSTPDGNVLLFESRADLTGYDPEGHAQVYRYDSVAGTLQCLSCNPTGAASSGEASLQSILQGVGEPEPSNSFVYVNNLRADGLRAFFQTEEALVIEDADGLQDVYEWEADGVGTCKRPEGCVYLISSGRSERDDYLYAVSDSGDDVFFTTTDLLLPADTERTRSIYDARVGGGFSSQCSAASCPPEITPPLPPALMPPASPPSGRSGNLSPRPPKKCRKGKRKVKRNGKVVCVKKKKHRRAGSGKKGSR
jgi:hypothetical protein